MKIKSANEKARGVGGWWKNLFQLLITPIKCCLGRPSGMGEMLELVSVTLQHGLNAAWEEQAGGGGARTG